MDFIDCAESLVRLGYSRPDLMAALGMSAGTFLFAVCCRELFLFWFLYNSRFFWGPIHAHAHAHAHAHIR